MVIYVFTFPNQKHYVGRTVNFEQRLAEHKHIANKGFHHPLYNAIRKYGWDNITKEIVDSANTLDELVAKEYEYIVKYNSIREGYNLTENTSIGGSNWEGRKHTQEYRDFIENLRRINTGENNTQYGIPHTEESKGKMKEKAKGRFTLPWYIQKYGEEEGTQKYNDRCQALKNRNYNKFKDPATGRFHKTIEA
jgi:group I intron endonuclease